MVEAPASSEAAFLEARASSVSSGTGRPAGAEIEKAAQIEPSGLRRIRPKVMSARLEIIRDSIEGAAQVRADGAHHGDGCHSDQGGDKAVAPRSSFHSALMSPCLREPY
jgi:hypothetical protein